MVSDRSKVSASCVVGVGEEEVGEEHRALAVGVVVEEVGEERRVLAVVAAEEGEEVEEVHG